jgi:glycosyltransferase involved in cell wall biosynthesis
MKSVLFFCYSSKDDFEIFDYYKQDIIVLRQQGYEVYFASNYTELIKHIFKVDFIFIWWWTYAFLPVILAKVLKKPTIITGTFNFKIEHKIFNSVKDYFDRPIYQRILIKFSVKNSSLNLFVNEIEKNECKQYFKLDNAEFYPHIISANYFNFPLPERKQYLLNISWSGKHNIQRKGVLILIHSFAQVSKKFPDLKLILAGKKGDGFSEIEALIKSYNLENNITLLGEVTLEKKIELLMNSLLYVQPSLYEGFGVAIGEAMACGCCVISCPVGGVKSLLGNAGIYVKPNSISDLTEKLVSTLNSPEVIKNYQILSYNRAIDNFMPLNKLNRFKALFQNYIENEL